MRQGSNNIVIAHELMHTLGASDKYDLGSGAPLYPHRLRRSGPPAALPAGARGDHGGPPRAVGRTSSRCPTSLRDVVVGPATALEIRWRIRDAVAPAALAARRVHVGVRAGTRELVRELSAGIRARRSGGHSRPQRLGQDPHPAHACGPAPRRTRARCGSTARPLVQLKRRAIALRLGLLPQDLEDAFVTTALETVLIGRHPHLALWQWETAEDERLARAALAAVDMRGFRARGAPTRSPAVSSAAWRSRRCSRSSRASFCSMSRPITSTRTTSWPCSACSAGSPTQGRTVVDDAARSDARGALRRPRAAAVRRRALVRSVRCARRSPRRA